MSIDGRVGYLDKIYPFEAQAQRAAQIIMITESRLLSSGRGPQYDVETDLVECPTGWQIRWRKILADSILGCSGCGTCQSQNQNTPANGKPQTAKVLQFVPKKNREL